MVGREYAADFEAPLVPRLPPPEIVNPKKAAPEQILSQALHLNVVETDRANVGHEDERILEEFFIVESYDDVVGIATVPTDRGGGEFLEASHKVHITLGIVGCPSRAQRFAAHTRVLDSSKDEGTINWCLGIRIPGWGTSSATTPILYGGFRRRKLSSGCYQGVGFDIFNH